MKNLATTLMVVGLGLFLASSGFCVYRFATTETVTTVGAVSMILSAVMVCFSAFMRSRAIARTRIFEATDKDKAQIQELRRELNIGRLLARFLGGLGALACVAGIMSFSGIDSSGKPDLRGGIDCFVFGGVLILPAFWLAKRSRLSK